MDTFDPFETPTTLYEARPSRLLLLLFVFVKKISGFFIKRICSIIIMLWVLPFCFRFLQQQQPKKKIKHTRTEQRQRTRTKELEE